MRDHNKKEMDNNSGSLFHDCLLSVISIRSIFESPYNTCQVLPFVPDLILTSDGSKLNSLS
jgi:hypothetical protein